MTQASRLSITIIGFKEAYHLKELLPTLSWAEEIVYVDCESGDQSLETARAAGCVTFSQPNNPNLNINKAFAMAKATGDWVFYLDPDERIPQELSSEIRRTITSPGTAKAFELNRKNHYFGRWLRYGSQYPDTQLRLFRRGYAEFPQQHVHEKLKISGPVGRLKSDLHHHPYLNISQYFHKFDFYTAFEARFLYNHGSRPGVKMAFRYLISKPLTRFFRRYLLKGGFRDGWPGLFAALFDGMNFVVRYFKLLEIAGNEKNMQNE